MFGARKLSSKFHALEKGVQLLQRLLQYRRGATRRFWKTSSSIPIRLKIRMRNDWFILSSPMAVRFPFAIIRLAVWPMPHSVSKIARSPMFWRLIKGFSP